MLMNAQTTVFFNDDQMGIPHSTVIQPQNEGIMVVDNLVDFEKDTVKQIAVNLGRPGGRIPDVRSKVAKASPGGN